MEIIPPRGHAIMLTIDVWPVACAIMLTRYLSLSISAGALLGRQAGPLSQEIRRQRSDRRRQPQEAFEVICVWRQERPHDGVQLHGGRGANQILPSLC